MASSYYPEDFHPSLVGELCITIRQSVYEAAVLATSQALASRDNVPLVPINSDWLFRGEEVLPQMDGVPTPVGDDIGVHPGCRETSFPTLVGRFYGGWPHDVASQHRKERMVVSARKVLAFSGLFGKPKVRLTVWNTPFNEPSKIELAKF